MPLDWDPDMGDWIVNGFGMITPAMKPLNLELLWSAPELDDDNVSLDGVDGTLERDPFEAQAVHAILMQLVGDVTHAGGSTASLKAGTAANYFEVRDALRKSAWPRSTSCDTTVDCPHGVTVGGPVQVQVGPLGPDGGPVSRFTVTVTIPAGALVEL